jgi:class 3 adenylate cyclase
MSSERVQRRLAAILAADVVGFSRLMERDEGWTLAMLKDRRRTIVAPLVAQHQGRIVKVMGDGVLVEFASAANAVQGALELQARMAAAKSTYRTGSRRVHAAILAQLGRMEEAHREAELFMISNPRFTVGAWIEAHPFADDETRQHFIDGYRKAGLLA